MERQRRQIDLAKELNKIHAEQLQKDAQLEARIEAFEMAFKMQTEATEAFDAAMDDDLNSAEALAAVYEYVRDTNSAMDSGEFRAGNVAGALAFLAHFDSIFDVLKPTVKEGSLSDAEVETLIAERTSAKKNKDFARADAIRKELSDKGVILEDTKEGVRWKRA